METVVQTTSPSLSDCASRSSSGLEKTGTLLLPPQQHYRTKNKKRRCHTMQDSHVPEECAKHVNGPWREATGVVGLV